MPRLLVRPLVLVGLLLFAASAHADDRPSFARAALAAFEQDQTDVLTAFAADEHGSAWLVVDGLRSLGRRDAAVALAQLRAKPDRDALVRYAKGDAKAWTYVTLDTFLRLTFEAEKGAPPTLDALAALRPPSGTAAESWHTYYVYMALDAAGRKDEALAKVEASSQQADTLGWMHLAGTTSLIAGALNLAEARIARSIEQLERAAARLGTFGGPGAAALATYQLGSAHLAGFDLRKARVAFERAVETWPDANTDRIFPKVLVYLAKCEMLAGEMDAGEQQIARAVEQFDRLGDLEGSFDALLLNASIQRRRSAFDKALAIYRTLLQRAVDLRDEDRLTRTHRDLAVMYLEARDATNARQHFAIAEERGGGQTGEYALANAAMLSHIDGDLLGAVRLWEAAVSAADAIGNEHAASTILSNLVTHYTRLGRFADASKAARRAVRLKRELGLVAELPGALENLGTASYFLGHHREAVESYEQALDLYTGWGDAHGTVRCLNGLSGSYPNVGRGDDAVSAAERALALAREHGFRHSEASALLELGRHLRHRGELREALDLVKQAEALFEALGDTQAQITTWITLSKTARLARDFDTAERIALEALEAVDVFGLNRINAQCELAFVRVQQARWGDALDLLRTSVLAIEASARGLDPLSAARMREELAYVHLNAIDVARRSGNATAMAEFLERGRSRALLDAMARSEATLGDVASPELATRELDARRRLQAAIAHHRQTRDDGDRRAARSARTQRDAAQSALEAIVAEIRTATGPAGDVFLPEPATLAEVQALLAPDEALVYYNQTLGKILALVVTRETAKPAVLTVVPFLELTTRPGLPTKKPYVVPKMIPAIQRRLVTPLQLDSAVRRVFVSAGGRLLHVPFGLLFDDREVVYLPSATTYRVLRQRALTPGHRVLGFGDPHYATGPIAPSETRDWSDRLRPLPASREEVEAVADVAFLGKDATESALREQLASPQRWRAVHLACHGLLESRPMRSALALTPDDKHDGFLSVIDLFDPTLAVRADLVVLSACESARGEGYRVEGVLGLVSALFASGAPRVLCASWQVDDAATSALMTRFYALWHPDEGTGVSAATALKQAQAHVRAQPGWEHPYYWAAWQLWGLP